MFYVMHLSLETPTPRRHGEKRKKKPHLKGENFKFKPQLEVWIFQGFVKPLGPVYVPM